jgi:dihydrofolate synthase/folylpolyglutamate synthase
MGSARPTYVDLLRRLDRARSAGVELGLDRTRTVLSRLGDPQRRAITVQIAGTNGKGSTAAMSDAILRAAGLRTGLYTSPHLCRFTERIRIDGHEIDGDRLAELDQAIAAIDIPLTYFEIATVLAFLAFADARVDVVVGETGLGGRLDAVTTCEPVATAITSIAFDHAEILGSTLEAIAFEKAGIAKAGVPLFLGPLPAAADAVIAAHAREIGAPVLRFGNDLGAAPVAPALLGAHQAANAALAVALARAAAQAAGRALDARAIESGLRDVMWPGRTEWQGTNLLFDCAHNAEGAESLAAVLATLPARRRALVFAAVVGKPVEQMLATLAPGFDAIVVTRSSNERSMRADALAALVPAHAHASVVAVDEPAAALATARSAVGADGLVVAAGSTFLIGDLRCALLGELRDPIPTSDPISTIPS